MKVELKLVTEDGGECQVTNILAVNELLIIHSTINGEMCFAVTENLRVVGREDEKGLIFELLKRKDVTVVNYRGEKMFHAPDWNRDQVDHLADSVLSSIE